MFTVFAILFTIVGGVLFGAGNRPIHEFRLGNNIGGVMLIIACILWIVVFVALAVKVMFWLWVHAP